MTIGDRIKRLRERRGLTQGALAKSARVPLSTLNVVERGIRKGERLSVETVIRLARALGVSLDYLVGMYTEDEADEPAVWTQADLDTAQREAVEIGQSIGWGV